MSGDAPLLGALIPALADRAAAAHAMAMAGEVGEGGLVGGCLSHIASLAWDIRLAGEAGLILLRHAAEEDEVLTVGVAPAARRQGLASALLAAGYHTLAPLGRKRLLPEVAVDNLPAEELYRRGSRPVGRWRYHYKRSGA